MHSMIRFFSLLFFSPAAIAIAKDLLDDWLWDGSESIANYDILDNPDVSGTMALADTESIWYNDVWGGSGTAGLAGPEPLDYNDLWYSLGVTDPVWPTTDLDSSGLQVSCKESSTLVKFQKMRARDEIFCLADVDPPLSESVKDGERCTLERPHYLECLGRKHTSPDRIRSEIVYYGCRTSKLFYCSFATNYSLNLKLLLLDTEQASFNVCCQRVDVDPSATSWTGYNCLSLDG